MVKYGKKEHLQQIIDGKMRFTPSQHYIDIEEAQQIRGQGDRLEGRMELSPGKFVFCNPNHGEVIRSVDEATATVSIYDVDKMLLSCFAAYDEKCIIDYVNEKEYKILLPNEIQECINRDFPVATHALIILEPNKFIQRVCDIKGHKIIGDSIKYFRRDEPEKYVYWATGGVTLKSGKYTLYGKNRYRFLLTKDKSFENQHEYRFICLDTISEKPIQYSFEFISEYMLVPIRDLQKGIQVNLKENIRNNNRE